MTAPAGWFPDPDGTPGRQRWWNGTSWTAQTQPAPSSPGPSATTSRSARRAQTVALVVLLAVGLAAGTAWLVLRTLGSSTEITAPPPVSTVSAGRDDDPSASPSATPVRPDPSGARPAGCDDPAPDAGDTPPVDGRVHGGPLSYPVSTLPGWTGPTAEPRIPYGRDAQMLYQVVATEQRGWQSSAVVGVSTFDPYPGSRAAAQTMLQCVITSSLYQSLQVQISSQRATALTVDGTSATRVDAVISFDDPSLVTKGSRLWIIVVDTRPVTFFFAAVPKESTDLTTSIEKVVASLTVD